MAGRTSGAGKTPAPKLTEADSDVERIKQGTIASFKATATTPATVAAQPSTTTMATPQAPAVAGLGLGIQFAKSVAKVKVKSDRPFCDHVDVKGRRCSLRVMVGFDKCVNHVPDESKLTEEEAVVVVGWKSEMTDEQWVRFVSRAIGWWKTKKAVAGTPEGDEVLAELGLAD